MGFRLDSTCCRASQGKYNTINDKRVIKVIVFGFVEFFLLLLGAMMLCQCIQSSIRSIICGVFIVRYLVSHGDVEKAKK